MDKGINHITQTNLATDRPKILYKNFGLFTTLTLLFILLAGHDSINPRLGDANDIDFYLDETSHLLEIQSKTFLLNANLLDKSFENKLKELSLLFYKSRNFSPAWTLNLKRSDNLDELISLIDSATYLGFPPTLLNSSHLSTLLDDMEKGAFNENSLGKRIDLEMEATQIALRYIIYLKKGIVISDTTKQFSELISKSPTTLNTAIETNALKKSFLSWQPKLSIYKDMISGLAKLIEVKDTLESSVTSVPNNILAEAFFYTGFLNSPTFDSINTTQNTIKSFQKGNKLTESGELTKNTMARLIKGLSERYSIVALNLDRLRKMDSNSDNYILVNIPEYKLHVFNNQIDEKQYKIVVGTKKTPTPILSSNLKRIITNPYWTVPNSILINEMLPKIRKDSSYLTNHGYFIINNKEERIDEASIDWNENNPLGSKYWIRQNNGGGNALGKIKFIFPNNSSIFLHDTPSKRLFKKESRAYSHGCIRVENPDNLAQYIVDSFNKKNTEPVNIKESIKSKKRDVIQIESNIEVHLQYLTCLTDENNRLIFFKDIYKYDDETSQNLSFKKVEL